MGSSFWSLNSPEPRAPAALKAEAIEAAHAERKPLCQHCHNWFVPREWSFAERFHCRSILAIPDSTLDPIMCDGCLSNVLGTFNRQVTNVGTSNAQPTNLLLQHLG